MQINAFASGKITIFLSSRELCSLGIPIEKLASRDPEIRLIMIALYRAASEKAGMTFDASQLLISALPTRSGGILHFLPRSALKLTAKRKAFLYEFSDGSSLLDAIELLYKSESARGLESALYCDENSFFLEIFSEKNLEILYRVKELSDNFYPIQKKELRKRGKTLAEKDAILKTGALITGL